MLRGWFSYPLKHTKETHKANIGNYVVVNTHTHSLVLLIKKSKFSSSKRSELIKKNAESLFSMEITLKVKKKLFKKQFLIKETNNI